MRRSKSGARRPTSLEDEIAHLCGLDLKGLRARWQSVTGRHAPPHLSRQLLFAMVAYRVQADALGDLDVETLRFLKTIGSARSHTATIPMTDAFHQRRRKLLPGTILTREWNGQMHRVMVVDSGFAFDGRSYDSLSTIAFTITGTKWSGPRFFGLRDKVSPEVTP